MNLQWRGASTQLSKAALIVYLLMQEEGEEILSPTKIEEKGFMTKGTASKAIQELISKEYLTEDRHLILKEDEPTIHRQSDEGKRYSVYMLLFSNGKVYYGITCRDVFARWNGGEGYRYHEEMYAAIQAEGWEAINKKILMTGLSKEEAVLVESKLIESQPQEKSYNKKVSIREDVE